MAFQHKGFERASLDLIREFEAEGWVFEVSSKGHAIGRAPDGVTTTSVARRLSRANRSQQNAEADLKRWRTAMAGRKDESLVTLAAPILRNMGGFHPSRIASVCSGVALGWQPEQMVNGAISMTRSGYRAVVIRKSDRPLTKREFSDIRGRLTAGGDPLVRQMALAMSEEDWSDYVLDMIGDAEITERVRLAVVPGTTDGPDVDLASESTVAPALEPPGEHLTVVADQGERRPWTARRGGRRTYESKAVEEIVVEGVVVGYGCSKCEAEDDDPHFIAAHYRRAHRFRRGREEQNPDLPPASEYHPSERLVRALMDFLAERGDMGGLEETAIAALTWMSTRPDLPPPGPVVPLTDAQIVERIRRLVGAEDSVEEVETLTEEVERLEARVAELEAFLQAADERADRLQSDLDAWLALAPRPAEG